MEVNAAGNLVPAKLLDLQAAYSVLHKRGSGWQSESKQGKELCHTCRSVEFAV